MTTRQHHTRRNTTWRRASVAAASVAMFVSACTPTAPGADTSAPVIDVLSVAPLTVDTSGGSATVTMTVDISEPESAVASTTVNFSSPSGGQTLSMSVTPANLIAGDTSDGTFETSAALPQHAEQGTWTAVAAYTVNTAGAFWLLDAPTLAANGLAASFEQVGAGDADAPTLTTLTADPAVIDTSTSGQIVTVTATITDDVSGHDTTTVRFNSPSQSEFVVATFNAANRIAGDELSGTYAAAVLVPLGSEGGSWSAQLASTDDAAGNLAILDAGMLAAAGLNASFDQVG